MPNLFSAGLKAGGAGDSSKALDFKALSNNGKKAILLTNVASKCGKTKGHYGKMKELLDGKGEYADLSGKLLVVGCPCNQFGGQEPKSNPEIQEFVKSKMEFSKHLDGKGFVLTDKINVNGDGAHKLYKDLKNTAAYKAHGAPGNKITWNFGTYWVFSGTNGELADGGCFYKKPPTDAGLVGKIREVLGLGGGAASSSSSSSSSKSPTKKAKGSPLKAKKASPMKAKAMKSAAGAGGAKKAVKKAGGKKK